MEERKIYKCSCGSYGNWQGFVRWYNTYIKMNIKPTFEYYEITNNLKNYTISEYPNGNLFIIYKEDNIMSGVWFYIDGIKIDLIC